MHYGSLSAKRTLVIETINIRGVYVNCTDISEMAIRSEHSD